MLYAAIAETSKQLVETSSRKKKVELLARLLGQLAPDERPIAARHLSGDVAHKLGIGYATVGELHGQVAPAAVASLEVVEVDRRFAAIAGLTGAGSGRAPALPFSRRVPRAPGRPARTRLQYCAPFQRRFLRIGIYERNADMRRPGRGLWHLSWNSHLRAAPAPRRK